MSGPWSELRTSGTVGPSCVELVYDTVDAVRRFDRYPPPEGADRWTATEVQEFAHDFLFGNTSSERLAKLVAIATDEDSFERVLEAAVRNEFRMQARRTDAGAVLRALTHAVERQGDIVFSGTTAATRTWSLPQHKANQPYSGSVNNLIRAAYDVPQVRLARWSNTSQRRPPIAEPDSLRRVLRAVLEAAGAPMTPRQMLDVVLARFPLASTRSIALTDEHVLTDTGTTDAHLLVADVWDQLTDNERLVAGIVDLPVREIAAETGLSRSTAHRAATGARAVLATYLADIDDQAGVVSRIAQASSMLRSQGTALTGSASATREEQ